jgi:hypothetical protein
MKLRLTEKQINRLLTQITENQEVIEQDTAGTDPESAKPSAGTSSQQSGGKGYPEVGKWESGITRGPANQLSVTKWSDIVGGGLKRGKANQLKEQQSNWEKEKHKYVTDYEKREYRKTTNMLQNMDPHTILPVLALGAAFVPFVGPILSLGLGLTDAYIYKQEGDDKMAGMMVMFSLLPGVASVVSKIPGIKQLGPKLMSELGKKLSMGAKLNQTEVQIVNQIAKNKQLIQSEMVKIGKDASIRAAKENVKQQAKKQIIKKQLKSGGKTVLGYGTAGVAYDKTYDYIERKKEEENLRKLNQMLGLKN